MWASVMHEVYVQWGETEIEVTSTPIPTNLLMPCRWNNWGAISNSHDMSHWLVVMWFYHRVNCPLSPPDTLVWSNLPEDNLLWVKCLGRITYMYSRLRSLRDKLVQSKVSREEINLLQSRPLQMMLNTYIYFSFKYHFANCTRLKSSIVVLQHD